MTPEEQKPTIEERLYLAQGVIISINDTIEKLNNYIIAEEAATRDIGVVNFYAQKLRAQHYKLRKIAMKLGA